MGGGVWEEMSAEKECAERNCARHEVVPTSARVRKTRSLPTYPHVRVLIITVPGIQTGIARTWRTGRLQDPFPSKNQSSPRTLEIKSGTIHPAFRYAREWYLDACVVTWRCWGILDLLIEELKREGRARDSLLMLLFAFEVE